MSPEELEEKMRNVLESAGKSQAEIDRVVPFLLGLRSINTDDNRLIFYNEWKDKVSK